MLATLVRKYNVKRVLALRHQQLRWLNVHEYQARTAFCGSKILSISPLRTPLCNIEEVKVAFS